MGELCGEPPMLRGVERRARTLLREPLLHVDAVRKPNCAAGAGAPSHSAAHGGINALDPLGAHTRRAPLESANGMLEDVLQGAV